MPIYEYYCNICGKEIELQQKVGDDAPTCNHDMDPEIDGVSYFHTMNKKISKSSFQLKGSSWAKDSYSRGNKK